MNEFCEEFLKGMKACDDGSPCLAGASEAFERGYSAQYELEAIQDQKTDLERGN